MKLYLAGPLFTSAERAFNTALASSLRDAGHEVFVPQDQEPGRDAAGIFATDRAGIDWSEGLVAVMDGPDPDSGTCWECGYAYGSGKPVVLLRTDIRSHATQRVKAFNPMLTESADEVLEMPLASAEEAGRAVAQAIAGLAGRTAAPRDRG